MGTQVLQTIQRTQAKPILTGLATWFMVAVSSLITVLRFIERTSHEKIIRTSGSD